MGLAYVNFFSLFDDIFFQIAISHTKKVTDEGREDTVAAFYLESDTIKDRATKN